MLYLTGDEKKRLKLVLGVAPQDCTRPVLQTVLVEVREGTVTFVTVDGFRLAAMRFRDEEVEGDFSINVGAKVFAKLLPRGKKPVELSVHESGVVVDGVHSAVPVETERPFPDWRSTLPKGNEASETRACFQWPYAETLVLLREAEGAPVRTMYLGEAIHEEEDGPHAWAWTRGDVSYLYCLMPMMGGDGEISFDSLEGWRGEEAVQEASEGVPGGEGSGDM